MAMSLFFQLCTNSWGTQWGERGLFRIVRGQDECKIESFVVGVWGKVNGRQIRKRSGGSRRRNFNQLYPLGDQAVDQMLGDQPLQETLGDDETNSDEIDLDETPKQIAKPELATAGGKLSEPKIDEPSWDDVELLFAHKKKSRKHRGRKHHNKHRGMKKKKSKVEDSEEKSNKVEGKRRKHRRERRKNRKQRKNNNQIEMES